MANHFDQFVDETIYHRLNRLIDRLNNHIFARMSECDSTMMNHVRRELQQINDMLYMARQEYAGSIDKARLKWLISQLLEISHAEMRTPATISDTLAAYHDGYQTGLMTLARSVGVVPDSEPESDKLANLYEQILTGKLTEAKLAEANNPPEPEPKVGAGGLEESEAK